MTDVPEISEGFRVNTGISKLLWWVCFCYSLERSEMLFRYPCRAGSVPSRPWERDFLHINSCLLASNRDDEFHS
jgi:hypothetical protein